MLHNHHAVYPPIPITDIPGDDDVIILTMWSPSRSHWVPASKNLLLLHLYSLTRSEMIKSTEHNWWKFSRAMRYIITDISSCYHHPHSPAIRATSLLHLLSCQFFLLVLPNWLNIMNHGCSHPCIWHWLRLPGRGWCRVTRTTSEKPKNQNIFWTRLQMFLIFLWLARNLL